MGGEAIRLAFLKSGKVGGEVGLSSGSLRVNLCFARLVSSTLHCLRPIALSRHYQN